MRKEKKMKTHGAGNHGVLETPCVEDKYIENILIFQSEGGAPR